jgi:uncharacterized protein
MLVSRSIEKLLLDYLELKVEHANVLLVHGARQVGKTLLCSQVLSQCSHSHRTVSVNLEEKPDIKLLFDSCQSFADFEMLLKTKLGFSPGGESVLFIDEAQESKSLGGFVRFMKEKWSHTKCILTGSSMSRLFDKDVRIPVGRTQDIVVRPFSFREFLRAQGLESTLSRYLSLQEPISSTVHDQLLKLFDNYLQVGGLPAAVLASLNGSDYRDVQALIFASQRDDFYRKRKTQRSFICRCDKSGLTFAGPAGKFKSYFCKSPRCKTHY